ncbi:hypothetical protein CICLE_v10010578mg, partial [Citrus x clementina]
GDRLSNLPEPIIHHIFSFLETIDVVRASAVSRKWRYLWLSIPYLNFNVHNICSNPLERWSLQTTNEKFKDFVNWVLFSPLLENLKMDSCCFPDLKILDISSNSLKSLTLERIEFGGDELDNYKLKIACSNLESFNIFAPLLPDFTLESLNSLQNAFIFLETIGEYMEAKEICHRMSKILNGLRDVKVLKLSCTLYQRSYFSASFNNLKSLILCVTTAEWTVPLIIRLLNHSPNLEVLTIYFDSDEYYDDWEIPDKVILCLTCHLKTVELIDFSGNENELELVRFLLKNGHVLQKLRVSWLE